MEKISDPVINIASLFMDAAARFPQHVAIDEMSRQISYAELKQRVLQRAAYFESCGIQKGDRVLVFVPMSIELYTGVLALFHLGATAVFLDEWVNRERMILCCRLAACKAFLAGKKVRWLARSSRTLRKIPVWLKSDGISRGAPDAAHVQEDDTALITFTTGSTGIPKAARRTHAFLYEQFKALQEEMNPHATDVNLTLLPIVLFVNLGVGSTSVIPVLPKKYTEEEKAYRLAELCHEKKITSVTSSPALLLLLADKVKGKPTVIEKVFTGGAPVFPADARKLCDGFNNAEIKIVYGSTEAEPISHIMSGELMHKTLENGLPVGIPYHKTQVKIIRITDEPVVLKNGWTDWELPTGETGEIVVSGDHVLKYYYNNEAALIRNKIREGNTTWHRTGDSGCMSEKGELFLWGRCAQLIICNGKYISPFIMENQLRQIPGVSCGTLMEIQGNILCIVESSLPPETVKAQVDPRQYDELHVVKKIPRDPRHNSKIDYPALRELFS